ncbi:putative nuclease HARBI1 [Merluccius polli]|uniref:Nuclease HARBI1 n=1 Tax=Merluccius polli TaxID=89951 RepID=A0AA47N000_MERPO|nr:putative nuclease HARBI1 [Merluccius polli]
MRGGATVQGGGATAPGHYAGGVAIVQGAGPQCIGGVATSLPALQGLWGLCKAHHLQQPLLCSSQLEHTTAANAAKTWWSWKREKVGLLKDVCGLLREAAVRDKAFQKVVILLKRAKLDIAARRLALEEKLGQPAQLSIILPEHQDTDRKSNRKKQQLWFVKPDVYNDAAVIQRYRLPRNISAADLTTVIGGTAGLTAVPREAIGQLLGTITQDVRRATRRSFALTPQVQLLAALGYYATGSFLQVVGDGLGLSKASVCRSVQAVTYSLLRLVLQQVRFPTTRDECYPRALFSVISHSTSGRSRGWNFSSDADSSCGCPRLYM